jgi:hypothetical protein
VCLQPVDDRMAGGAQGDQRSLDVPAGFAVMDGVLMGCPAGLAAVAIPRENGLAVASEASAGVGGLGIAAAAQAGDRWIGATRTEQPRLENLPQGPL